QGNLKGKKKTKKEMRLTRLDQITLRTGVAIRMLVKCSDMLVISFETYHALPIAPQPQLGANFRRRQYCNSVIYHALPIAPQPQFGGIFADLRNYEPMTH
ncbi:uncharacterized protein N7506_003793, partial [Penicillium brevicompactum]|uniref:uncharacterized protein n=1 Tax=Penicillium brevicompactum TaxID=5074 RepID=UPI0025422EE0